MKEKLSNNFIIGIIALVTTFGIGFIIAKTGAWAFGIIPLILAAIIAVYYMFKNPFFGFLLIIFFLPFERVPTYDLGGINIKINVLLGFITVIAWILALMFKPEKWKVYPNAIAVPLTLFVIALFLSLPGAGDKMRALQVLVSVLFTISLSVLAANMIDSEKSFRKIALVLFLSSLVVCAFGFFQFGGDVLGLPQSLTLLKEGYDSKVFGFPRVQAFSMEPLYLANLILIPIGLAAGFLFLKVNLINFKYQILNRWWMTILLLLLLIIFVLTVSRGGYLGLFFTALVLAIFLFRKIFTWKNVLVGIIVLVAVFYGVSYALSQGQTRATGEFLGHIQLQDFNKGESVQGRLTMFRQAYIAFDWNPLVGVGIGNFGPYYLNYPPATPHTGWPIVNNQYIELLAETGLVGVISFGLVLIVLIVRSLIALKYAKNDFLKASMIGLLAAFVGVLVQYNFFSTLYIIHIWVLVGLMIGVQNLIFKDSKN